MLLGSEMTVAPARNNTQQLLELLHNCNKNFMQIGTDGTPWVQTLPTFASQMSSFLPSVGRKKNVFSFLILFLHIFFLNNFLRHKRFRRSPRYKLCALKHSRRFKAQTLRSSQTSFQRSITHLVILFPPPPLVPLHLSLPLSRVAHLR